MASRSRRKQRIEVKETQIPNCPSSEEDKFTGDIRRRCIPVDCIPLCPICQEHSADPIIWFKKIAKAILAIIIIALLASYLASYIHWGGLISEKSPETDENDAEINNPSSKDHQWSKTDSRMSEVETKINNLVKEVINIKAAIENLKQSGSGHLNDKMKTEISDLIKKELNLYDSDKTGLPDFALENLGGCILSVRNTKTYKEGSAQLSILGVPIMSFATDPRAVIQANMVPGECWAFTGTKGTVVIELITFVIVTHVSIEHISPKLSPTGDILSAPKEFSLKGLAKLDDKNPHVYGQFDYSSSGPTLQTFRVQAPTAKAYKIVEVSILSNQGNKDFTCLYRIRIHGKPDVNESNKPKS